MSNISSADHRIVRSANSSLLSSIDATGARLIRCDIVFGMPSQDCRGTGICKLSSDLDLPPNLKKNCRHTVAFAGRGAGENTVTLLFFRELLCVDLFRRQFRNGLFDMPEPCVLPRKLADSLGMDCERLLRGQYPVEVRGNCYRVDIKCG